MMQSMDKVIGCYDNLETLEELMPDFHDLKWKLKVTDTKGVMYGKQAFPWPMACRDMLFHVTGLAD